MNKYTFQIKMPPGILKLLIIIFFSLVTKSYSQTYESGNNSPKIVKLKSEVESFIACPCPNASDSCNCVTKDLSRIGPADVDLSRIYEGLNRYSGLVINIIDARRETKTNLLFKKGKSYVLKNDLILLESMESKMNTIYKKLSLELQIIAFRLEMYNEK